MARNVYFSVCLVLLCSQLIHVIGHGWLMTPTPRSGGGTGSGNASTSSPCGKAGPTTIVGRYPVGSTLNTEYKAVNGHGGPCTNCVTFTLSYTAATATTPAASDFTGANGIVLSTAGAMDPNTGTVETLPLTLPTTAGKAVLQFMWQAKDGSKWFDCAYIQIDPPTAPSPCLANNGGCSPNAACTTDGSNNAVCKCKSGFFGDGHTCNALPADVPIVMVLNQTTFVAADQDAFTSNIASLLGIDPNSGRILFDHKEFITDAQSVTIAVAAHFAISANSTTGASGMEDALRLRAMVSTMSPTLNSLGYRVTSVQVQGVDASPVAFGGPIPESSGSAFFTSSSAGVIAGAVISMIAVVGFLVYLRVRNSNRTTSTNKNFTHMNSQKQVAVATTTHSTGPVPTPAHPSPPHETSSLPPGWSLFHTDDGVPYYHNDVTGESQWEPPRV